MDGQIPYISASPVRKAPSALSTSLPCVLMGIPGSDASVAKTKYCYTRFSCRDRPVPLKQKSMHRNGGTGFGPSVAQDEQSLCGVGKVNVAASVDEYVSCGGD